jgi:predicted transcriptional regulator
MHLGARRIEATLIAYLAHHKEVGTQQIVEATGLRQPEVSVGMRELRDRGWVEAEPIPRSSKGRPMNRYHLKAARQEIRQHYEQEGRKAIQGFQEALDRVQKALS